MRKFHANCLPVLIGSLPMDDHRKAADLVFEHVPEIPLWVQLPIYKKEGMIHQFMPGMPGLSRKNDKLFIDVKRETFEEELLEFYEDYMKSDEKESGKFPSRFELQPEDAGGFFEFLGRLETEKDKCSAVKGQITGPVTFGTSVCDQDGKAIFYNDQLRDVAVKLLAQKAKWQAKKLAKFHLPVFIFFDEPALAGFGSSAFISISREEVTSCFNEVIDSVHSAGGLAGIHVCANVDWPLVLQSSADIISFDAYSYFDRFKLYADEVKEYLNQGKILAWGIVPTSDADLIHMETTASIIKKLESQIEEIEKMGIERSIILSQVLITPSCGTGSLNFDSAKKVVELTRDVSAEIRKKWLNH